MPRPKKCRRICGLPRADRFGPEQPGGCAGEPVRMTLDEYEAIRLIDLLDCTQEECAQQMGVARTTVQAVYNQARRKLAQMLVDGRRLEIQGGDYELCPHSGSCCGKDCGRGQCGQSRCHQNHQGGHCCENRGHL
ncbi:MAG TPA: DUF134 domain-containing protein [Candidatus Anaerotruncus excrementipullorum]|uniref:UPF0251 protein H9736_09510 n=1 Tax=Candidatus Anaerotruncus excrementipullorum TaxID=2838465 RepID=A0A9D1WT89_9FIRM|nr:DUF134 domain-containing protein [Candidatus Anaerotruncus excrementipullorum]